MKPILFLVVLVAFIACTKARPGDEPSPAGTGSASTASRDATPAGGSDAATVAVEATIDAAARETGEGSSAVGAQAIADPTPVPAGSNGPANAMNQQMGGSSVPARGGRSLVVLKSKKALDASSLDAGKLMVEYIRKHQASVKQCFEELRAKDPAAMGLLTLHFAVDAQGAVTDVKVDGWNPGVATCVEKAMTSWRFTAPDKKTRFELVLDLVIG